MTLGPETAGNAESKRSGIGGADSAFNNSNLHLISLVDSLIRKLH